MENPLFGPKHTLFGGEGGGAVPSRTTSQNECLPPVRATAAAESGSGNEKALAGDPK